MFCPANFSNQWLESFVVMVFGIELSHVPEVLNGKTAHAREFLPQVGGQPLDDRFAPTFGGLAAGLKFEV